MALQPNFPPPPVPITITVAAMLCVLLIGCDSSQQETLRDGKKSNNSYPFLPVSEDKSIDFTKYFIRFGRGYGPIRFGMTHDQLIASAGMPERQLGTACEYLSNGFAVLFDRKGKVAVIMCGGFCSKDSPMIDRFQGATPEGIRMGSTLDEVLRTYGKPTAKNSFPRDPELVTVRYVKLGVGFAFRDERLVHITIRRLDLPNSW